MFLLDKARRKTFRLSSWLMLAAMGVAAGGCGATAPASTLPPASGLSSGGGRSASPSGSLPLPQPPVPLNGFSGSNGPRSPQLSSGDSTSGSTPGAPAGSQGLPAGPSGGRTAFEADVDRYMLALINQERAKVGAQPLTIDSRLHAAAWYHAMDMFTQGYIDHVDKQGLWGFDRARNFGFPVAADYSNNNENVADLFDSSDAQSLAQTCMWEYSQSPGHWQNILDPQWNVCGLGTVYRPDQAVRRSDGQTINPNCQQFGRL